MRNLIFTIALVLFLAPVSVFATNNATFSNGAQITANGVTVTVNGSSHDINSITVNGGNFEVTLSDDSSLTVRASGQNEFTVSPSGTYLSSQTCTADYNELVLQGTVSSDDDQTLTITPESSTCSSTGGGGSPGGGGGGGGGAGGAAPAPAPSPAPAPAPAAAAPTSAQVAATGELGQLVELFISLGIIPADKADKARRALIQEVGPSVSAVFTSGMGRGQSNADIKRLQQLLNSDADTQVASSGAGSSGNETNYFGPATERAVQKFQVKHGVAGPGEPGYGYVGPKTRAKLKDVFGDGVPAAEVAQPSAVAVEVSPVFSQTLSRGTSNADVKRLQQLLNSDPDTRVASSGVGSPGNETNYYGSLTEAAVKKFQAKYGVVSSGTPATTGYGLVGPQTRAKLKEVFGE